MVKQSLRGYLQLVSGYGEMTLTRATEAAQDLAHLVGLDQRLNTTQLSKQVATIAQDLLATAEANQRQVRGLVQAEVEKVLARADRVPLRDVDLVRQAITGLTDEVEELATMLRAHLLGAPTPAPASAAAASDEPVAVRTRPSRSAVAKRASAANGAPAKKAPARTTAKKATPTTASDPAEVPAAQKAPAKKAPAKKATTSRTPRTGAR